MKTFVFAALLGMVPVSAQAAVVVTFSGNTFAPVEASAGGSYVRTVEGTDSSIFASSRSQAVLGTVTIDTAALGANQGTAPDAVYYGNGGSFLTVTFTSTGATPVQLTGMGTVQSLDSASGLTFDLFDADDTYAYSLALFSNNAIPTGSFAGTLLPDFTRATGLFFNVTSRQGGIDSFVETVSQGNVIAVTQVVTGVDAPAVPEPASWAMMIAGIGVVGAAARRRRRTALATA